MIPGGYRLLTSADVGKVFGKDLELEVYIDTYTFPSVSIAQNTTINLTNFMTYTRYYDDMVGEGSMLYYLNELIFNMGWLISEDNLTTTNGLKVETYYTESDWNDFFYVKDKPNPYNITSSKPKITINCKDKIMTSDLTITRELWDGSYEEISNGYTLTLEGNLSEYLDEFSYSLDGGISYTKVNSLPVTIEEVTKIKFKISTTYEMFVGIESSDSSIDLGWFPDDETIETEEIEITSNTTLEIISNIV